MGLLRSYHHLYTRYWREYLKGLVALFFTSGILMTIPWLIKGAVDSLSGGVDGGVLLRYGLAIAVVAVVQAVIRVQSRRMILGTSRKIEYDLKRRFLEHLQRLPPSYYNRVFTGDLMSRAAHDIILVRALGGAGVMYLSNSIFVYAIALPMMLAIDPLLTVLVFLPFPVMAYLLRGVVNDLKLFSRNVQEALGALNALVQETLNGIIVVKAFRMEERQEARFGELNRDLMERNLEQARALGRLIPLVRITGGIGSMVIIFFGGMGVMRGEITYGDFVAFFAYLGLLLRPTVALGWILSLVQRAKVGLERLDEIFSTAATIADAPGAVATPEIRGAIELRGLTFRYQDVTRGSPAGPDSDDIGMREEGTRLFEEDADVDEIEETESAPVADGRLGDGGVEGRVSGPGEDGRPYAIRDISFSLDPGEVVAVVGSVGSGKSTMLKALPRLIEVAPGQVFLDGNDITRIPLEHLRRSVGYVPQDDFLFSISIAENITFGRPDASMEEIEEAARLAAVHETITSFPNGYETVVGERGITLSGGQRQRVALARALLIRPKVLVLDNALAHVDTETEREIMEGLHGRRGLGTILLATNRLARVMLADRIIVLEGGRMCAVGTHDELMADSREYRELYEHERLFEELAEL